MRDVRQLMYIVVLSAASLVLVVLAVAAVLIAQELYAPTALWGPGGAFRAGFFVTFLLGAGPAVLLGAPAYWGLWRSGRARWHWVLLIGAGLGVLVAVIEPALVAWGAGCGLAVAALVHVAAMRWLRLPSSLEVVQTGGADCQGPTDAL